MTYAPASIKALASYWVSKGGVDLGIVGDAAHAKRATYHNGRDRIVAQGGLATDYTCRTARDRSGLTNAASALDLGKLDGSFVALRRFSAWLVARCQGDAEGTSDIRDVIYTHGETVLRYDRERGIASEPRPGEADSSHLWHTHISFYRDSEPRSKVGLFAPYFVLALPDTGTEAPVTVVTIDKWSVPRRFKATTTLRRFDATKELSPIAAPYSATCDANVAIQGNPSAPTGLGFLRVASGGSAGTYILASAVTLDPAPPGDCAAAIAEDRKTARIIWE